MNRRRLLGLAGVSLTGGLTWDVLRAGGNVDVTGPKSRPQASDQEIAAYIRGCTQFGFDLLAELTDADRNQNLMISPLGLSGALAMTWSGARGTTQHRMRETLHFPHGQDRLHPTVGAMQYDLGQRGAGVQHRQVPQVWNVNRFELGLVNAMWGQGDYPFSESFLDTLDRNYGSGFRQVDFDANPDRARQQINQWGQQVSDGRVDELIPPDAIDRFTVFVLANAVSLKADWQQPFDPEDTEGRAFTRPDGTKVQVPMMAQEGSFALLRRRETANGVPYRMVELPYVGGNVSMVLAVPGPDRSLTELEAEVDVTWLESRFSDLDERGPGQAMVTMPRFTFENNLELTDQLQALGMTTAFDGKRADFSGMTDPGRDADGLHLDWVYHDTDVTVDEEGTVAVAVTGVGGEAVSLPPSITLDRPFLFCIRDRETDAVLFLGRVVDPSEN